jgi:anhydro-N-acetylmuramic acid kinase
MPPKSLDRNDFAGLLDVVSDLSDTDAPATLAAVRGGRAARDGALPDTARARAGHRWRAPERGDDGGLRAALACPVDPVEEVGLDGDMLEAQAFAYLAVRVARGLPTSAPGTTGVAAPVGGGRKSEP